MRKLITVILLFAFSHTIAQTYYFSMSTGDDSRTAAQAQNPATPWKTLPKAQTVAVAGNDLAFQRGDTWVGTLTIQGSGVIGNRITIGAYGTGAKPIISGFYTVPAWTNTGGNIWESTSAVSTLSTCNIASIGGANYSQGRTPNTGYYTINSTNGTSTIVSTSLNAGTINWTGAQVVMRKYRWIMDKYTVTSASGSTINFSSSGDAVQAGYGFFLMNDVRTLDQANEWSYSSSTKKMSIYKTSTPTNVKVPSVETGIDLNGKNYITIDNINFTGFNSYGILGVANDYINVTNCDFSFIGNSAIYLYQSGAGSSETCNFTGNNISEVNSMGIQAAYANNSNISNNTLLRIGRYAGMGQNGDVSYCAIVNWGDDQVTSYNNVKAAGYCGIRFDGNSALINRNLVDSTNFVKDDGGGIYVYPQQTGPSSTVTYLTRTVSENIVLNTLGAIAGGEPASNHDEGYAIYNDGTSPDIDYLNNTIHNSHYGFFSNAGKRNTIQGNTIYNCKRNIYIVNYNNFGLNNWTITDNTSVAKFADQYVLYTEPNAANLPATWTLNNNVYARPIDDTDCIWYDANGVNYYVTLAQWKASGYANGQDAASTKSPKAVTSVDSLTFVYNWSPSAVTTSLGANYIDMVNTAYNGSITLQPYTSNVLIRNGSSNTPPIANAGTDKTINLPTTTASLNGSGTSTTGGSITTYAWLKLASSPAGGTIASSSSAVTSVSGLGLGTYSYELTVTDNNGLTDKDTMQIFVLPAANIPPTANAGANQIITLPTSGVTLTGSGTDPDGTITAYAWVKLASSPATGAITSSTSASTTVTNLIIAGVYSFQLTVTDNNGATGKDTMTVTVLPASNIPPTANAGANQSITLPVNTATLTGSGTDTDGTITAYLWTILTGGAGSLTSTTTTTTSLINLVQGVYTVELRVTDNNGAVGRDTVQITVNAAIPVAPTATAGLDATITLPTNFAALNGSGTSNDGSSINSYLWTKLPSSPVTGTILSNTSAVTTATNLVAGVYSFQLRVGSTNGLFGYDTVQITVNTAPSVPPTVNAGVNQAIQLPTNSVTVTATAVASSGSITGYQWLQVSGGAATITSTTSASTTITGLVAGVYLFSVTATQTNGLTATDTVQVTVNANALPATGIEYYNASYWNTQKQVVGGWTSAITDNTLYFQFQKKNLRGTWGKVGANIIPKIGVVDYWGYDFSPTYGRTSSYRVKVFDKTGITYSITVNVYVPPKKTSSSIGGNIILE